MLYRTIPITFCFTLACAVPAQSSDNQDMPERVSAPKAEGSVGESFVNQSQTKESLDKEEYIDTLEKKLIESDAVVDSLTETICKLEAELLNVTIKRTESEAAKPEFYQLIGE